MAIPMPLEVLPIGPDGRFHPRWRDYFNASIVAMTNADTLDGKHAADFLGVHDKADDADKLDGQEATAFLGATATAVDAAKLGGVLPAGYAPATPAYVILQAAAALGGAQNLGALLSGLLKHTVVAGISTIARAVPGVDYEPGLGNPVVDGQAAVSTIAGVRSWASVLTAPVRVDVAYDPANFSASPGMTWGVDLADQLCYCYYKLGTFMVIWFHFHQTSITAPLGARLSFKIPGSFTAALPADGTFHYKNNASYGTGLVTTGAADTLIRLFLPDYTSNWAASVDATSVRGFIPIWTTT